MANKYGESGEAARLRDLYNAEKDTAKKAALRNQRRAARSAAGVQRGAGKTAGGLFGGKPQGVNWSPTTAGQAAQSQQNLNQYNAQLEANLNRVNESGPFGSSNYTTNPDGTISRSTSLAPEQQLVNQYQTLTDQSKYYGAFQKSQEAERQLQNPYSLSGVSPLLGANDMMGARKGVEDQLYGSWNSRMQPQFDREQSQFRQRMADQGNPMGSEQFQVGQQQIAQNQGDQRLQAMSQASTQGLTEMQGLHDMSYANRQQGVGEYEAQRYAPMNESNMFMQNARGVVSPNVSPTAQIGVAGTDLASTYLGYNPKYPPNGGGGGGGGGGGQASTGWLTNAQNSFAGGAGTGGGQNATGWGTAASNALGSAATGAVWGATNNKKNGGLFG